MKLNNSVPLKCSSIESFRRIDSTKIKNDETLKLTERKNYIDEHTRSLDTLV